MENHEFKYIKGSYLTGAPADICFYSDVERWNVQDFLWEFNYLVEDIKPSVIRIHINSCGGSCVEGISVFSKIIDCKIPTQCINDGLAASMASIIWSAGKEVYMKDYALLMIHNPFIDNGEVKEYDQVTEAFTKQLSIIYKQRFGLDDDKIKSIMDGSEGNDGTFFTAQEAVDAGFLSAEHIIKTPEAVRNQIAASISGVKDLGKISSIMGLADLYPNKMESDETISGKESICKDISNQNTIMENKITGIAAVLGLVGDKVTEENVIAEVNKLKTTADQLTKTKDELAKSKSDLSDAMTKIKGHEATIANLQNTLDEVKDSLKKYQDAEEEAKKKSIEEMVDAAIEVCKINSEDRETWIEAASANFELAKKTLNAIPAREKLSAQTNTEENKKKAKEELKDTEAELKEQVDTVVGKDFKFRSLED